MITVVSDTSPINYLILISRIELLPVLFEKVVLPPAVHRELNHPGAPATVAAWADSPPSWVSIESPLKVDPTIRLGAGESEAISLAMERQISIILIDERRGTDAAEKRGLTPVGTLNILEEAAAKGLHDFEQAITALLTTNFHIRPELIDRARTRLAARRGTEAAGNDK